MRSADARRLNASGLFPLMTFALMLLASPVATAADPYAFAKDISLSYRPMNLAVSPNGQYLAVTHYEAAAKVTIIKLADESKRVVNVGSVPAYAVFTLDSSRIFVSTFHGRTVSVIETTTGTVLKTISGIFSYGGPYAMDIHPGGGFIYVTDGGDDGGKVVRINTSTYATKNIPVGSGKSSSPYGLIFSPDGNRAYVSLYNDKAITILNTATDAVIATIKMTTFGGGRPYEMAITSDGRYLYVTDIDKKKVWIIDTQTNGKVGEIPIGYSLPWFLEMSPAEDYLFVASYTAGHLSVIDMDTLAIVQDTSINLRNVETSSDGSTLYVANYGAGTISLFTKNAPVTPEM